MSESVPRAAGLDPGTVKACCAQLYSQDWVRLLLGESFHPGGPKTTDRLAELTGIGPDSRVLDVACGRGTSAVHLARTTGCHAHGVDLSVDNVAAAQRAAHDAGVAGRCSFAVSDSEDLGFAEKSSYDVVVCECSFCTFPDKATAMHEFARVVKTGGYLGLADVTRSGPVPAAIQGLAGWVACVADAESAERYGERLKEAGFEPQQVESWESALLEMVHVVRQRLALGSVLQGVSASIPDDWDLGSAREITEQVEDAIRDGLLGYTIIAAVRR
ncbi:MAG: class I SAM-dependent methyltransferase [Candidatus Dormibacteria bacterium]